MKNYNVRYENGQLVNVETDKPLQLLEGQVYSIQGDDSSFGMDKAYSVEEKRKDHPNAYMPWSKEDDEYLEQLYCEKLTVKQLSVALGRNEGAIRSRIAKLELAEKY